MVEQTAALRHWGVSIGTMPTGAANSLTDVAGVTVGHCTLADDAIQTGVTAIKPHPGNLFRNKVPAAVHVINGFGKSIGLVQVDELGVLETPILLTNTFSIASAADGLLDYCLGQSPEVGVTTGTINPVVCECNDGYLNEIRGRHITRQHALEALANCTSQVDQGSVGAGRGMSCFGWKGGVGSSSRLISVGDATYTLGALVLSNFGDAGWLRLDGTPLGDLAASADPERSEDKGSVIIVLATDMPCSSRQLQRLAKRSVVGLARTGSYIGQGSGDIALAFSNAQTKPHRAEDAVPTFQEVHEDHLEQGFQAVALAVEEAVWNSLTYAETVVGRSGHTRQGISVRKDEILRRHGRGHSTL